MSKKSLGSRRYYTCSDCAWFRDITADRTEHSRRFLHPVYGWVSILRAAQLDVESHDCSAFETAQTRIRQLNFNRRKVEVRNAAA